MGPLAVEVAGSTMERQRGVEAAVVVVLLVPSDWLPSAPPWTARRFPRQMPFGNVLVMSFDRPADPEANQVWAVTQERRVNPDKAAPR